MRVRLSCAGLALAIAVLAASPAAASPTSVTGLSWLLSFNLKLEAHLTANCTFADSLGWAYHGPPHSNQRDYGTVPPGADPGKGSYDVATRRGSATGKGPAMIFDPLFASQGSGGKAFMLVDMGVQVAPHRVYLTGVIQPTRSRAVAKRRQRLAVIAKPRFSQGRRPNVLGKPSSSSWRYAVTGKAKITRKLAKAFNRARCTAPRFAAHSKGNGPVKPGTVLGNVTIGLLPATATGLAGHAYLQRPGIELFNDDDGTHVAVAPTGGAVPETINHIRYFRFGLAPGTNVPLACQLGANCLPAPGATLHLLGSLTLTYHGITATLGNLAAVYGADPDPTVTGTLNGAPVTIDADGLTEDFANRAGAVFGVPINGSFSPVATLFSRTGSGA